MTSPVANPLTHRLTQLASLSPAEIAVLDSLQTPTRTVSRNRELIGAGRRYDGLFVLIEGIAARSRILHDGRRQILNFSVPGDVLGFPGCFFETALYSIGAITDIVVSSVSFAQLVELLEEHPRLTATIFWSFAREAAMFAEHLIGVGRRSSLERVGHFLLELLLRLQAAGLGDESSYQSPLTQELIADALGLSVQHVNRTLRQLREDGLVVVEGQRIVIKDIEALAALTDFDRTYFSRFRIDAFWPQGGGAGRP